jgi:hypothetical protein
MSALIVFLFPIVVAVLIASPALRMRCAWVFTGSPAVILRRDGQLQTSVVRRVGDYYVASWYSRFVDNIELKKDGTGREGPFRYTWEPPVPANADWFKPQPSLSSPKDPG